MCHNKNRKQLKQPSVNEPPRVLPSRATGLVTQSQMYLPKLVGTIVCFKFNDRKFYEGQVTNYNTINKFYKIKYQDGDTKDYNHDKMQLYKKSSQRYSTQNKAKSAYYMFTNKYNKNIFFIPKKTTSNPIKRDYQRQWVSILLKHKLTELKAKYNNFAYAASGLNWDDKLNKIASYCDLFNHHNADTRQ